MLNFGHSVPTSLANLMVEVGTRHSRQTLFVFLEEDNMLIRVFVLSMVFINEDIVFTKCIKTTTNL